MPMSITPRGPVVSISRPIPDQSSNQNDVDLPLLTSILWSGFAISLYFNNFLHIQDPKLVFPFIDQNDSFLIRYFMIHETHRDGCIETILHINFRQLTLFASVSVFIPKPPSFFGLQTSDQDIFAFFGLRSGPDHKKAEHNLSISLMHPWGSLNADIQKFVKLTRTVFMSCKRPA